MYGSFKPGNCWTNPASRPLWSHLDNDCKTIDEQLEAANFAFAGKALAEVWSSMANDTHHVVAEYIEPSASETEACNMTTASAHWQNVHVSESQYFTQIGKCDDRSCCRSPHSSFFHPDSFLHQYHFFRRQMD